MSKRFVGKTGKPTNRKATTTTTTSRTNQIPPELLTNNQLNSLISQSLPPNYNFELHKTIHQVTQNNVAILGLQLPEGLLQFSLTISDIIHKFCPNCHQIIVLGDVTYGACCVDDYTAKALGCQMLIHYGHSCLIPVDQTSIKTLYVFVEIGIDRQHLADTIRANFPACMQEATVQQQEEKENRIKHVSIQHEEEQELHLAVVGTVQFVSAVQALKHELEEPSSPSVVPNNQPKMITPSAPDTIPHHHQPCRFKVTVPQVKPLSPGEILGCTAPKLSPEIDAILYLGDGRFHLESIMIANPTIPAFRYDPYEKKITHEGYDHAQMRAVRASAIEIGRESLGGEKEDSERGWAVVLGTLGRQGSLNVLKSITTGVATRAGGKKMVIPILLSELSAGKLGLLSDWIDVCVQTSCPRLSIDWGHDFLVDGAGRVVPLLNPYEAKVALGQAQAFQSRPTVPASESPLLDTYPMDFYADESLGDWTPRHGRSLRPARRPVAAPLPGT